MKEIENYNISKSQYGIITLIINLRRRWHPFRSWIYGDGYQFDIFDHDDNIIESLRIPTTEFGFDMENERRYRELSLQERDQIILYFIPIRLLKGDDGDDYVR